MRLARRAYERAAFACALGLLCACSAMGLGDYERVACGADDSICDALNAELPEGSCERYACSESDFGCELRPFDHDGDGYPGPASCKDIPGLLEVDCNDDDNERHPRRTEQCNRKDDDCDDYIDEGTKPGGEGVKAADVNGTIKHIGHTRLADGSHFLAVTADIGQAEHVTEAFSYAAGAVADRESLFDTEAPCPPLEESCSFRQLGLGATDTHLIGAGIHRAGCLAGQLRLAVGERGDDLQESSLASKLEQSNAALGVEPDAGQGCTDAGPCEGADDPRLAVLRAESPTQALAVFMTKLPEEGDCERATTFQPMGLGLFVKGGADNPRLVRGNRGAAEPFGDRPASGPASLVALGEDAGYVVAYPAGSAVALSFVPALTAEASVTEVTWSTSVESPEGGQVHEVALSAGIGNDGEPAGLALAFRTSVGRKDAVYLAQLRFDASDTPHIEPEKPMLLSDQGEVVAGPSLAYAANGFVAGAELPTGGFFVIWVEHMADRNRLMGVRVAEHEQHMLGDPFELKSERDAITLPFAFANDDVKSALGYGHVQGGDTLRLSELGCQE